jgi:hypothetical protein
VLEIGEQCEGHEGRRRELGEVGRDLGVGRVQRCGQHGHGPRDREQAARLAQGQGQPDEREGRREEGRADDGHVHGGRDVRDVVVEPVPPHQRGDEDRAGHHPRG